jgi:hypothetical protein
MLIKEHIERINNMHNEVTKREPFLISNFAQKAINRVIQQLAILPLSKITPNQPPNLQ